MRVCAGTVEGLVEQRGRVIEGSSITMESGVVRVCAGWRETAWTAGGLGEQRRR